MKIHLNCSSVDKVDVMTTTIVMMRLLLHMKEDTRQTIFLLCTNFVLFRMHSFCVVEIVFEITLNPMNNMNKHKREKENDTKYGRSREKRTDFLDSFNEWWL